MERPGCSSVLARLSASRPLSLEPLRRSREELCQWPVPKASGFKVRVLWVTLARYFQLSRLCGREPLYPVTTQATWAVAERPGICLLMFCRSPEPLQTMLGQKRSRQANWTESARRLLSVRFLSSRSVHRFRIFLDVRSEVKTVSKIFLRYD